MQGFCLGSWCSALRRPSEEPQRLCLRVVPEGQEANVFVFRIPIIYLWKVPSTPRLPSAGLSGWFPGTGFGDSSGGGLCGGCGEEARDITYDLTPSVPAMFLSPCLTPQYYFTNIFLYMDVL